MKRHNHLVEWIGVCESVTPVHDTYIRFSTEDSRFLLDVDPNPPTKMEPFHEKKQTFQPIFINLSLFIFTKQYEYD